MLKEKLKKALSENNTNEVVKLLDEGADLSGYTIIGFSNPHGEWSGNVAEAAKDYISRHPNTHILPISRKHTANEAFLKQFSGFINPGAGDSFPTDREFTLNDLNPATMRENEFLYQF